MTQTIDLAVFSEHSPRQKPLAPGWNARVYNTVETLEGSSIAADMDAEGHEGTGIISLGPGVYHITGTSIVTYNDPTVAPGGAGWDTRVRPNGGYSRLRYAADVDCLNEKAIVIGTISGANMLPSTIDTYLDVPKYAEVVFEHQAGFEGVENIYLQDNSANSTWHVFARIAIHRVRNTSTQYERAPLARVFDAAFGAYLAIPQAYTRLYRSYLNVDPKFVPTSDEGRWVSGYDPRLSTVLRSGVLRFGYARDTAPYVYEAGPPNAGLRGFDYELGNALTEIIRRQYPEQTNDKGLRAEWVGVTASEGGDAELAKFDALYAGLQAGDFDIAMSGLANISTSMGSPDRTRAVDWTAPTVLLHTNILYTGRDSHDLTDIANTTRERFIDAVKEWREAIILYAVNAGPSPGNATALAEAVNAAGGHATTQSTPDIGQLTRDVADQAVHFSVGDAVASSWIGAQMGFKGLNVDIAAATKPLQTAQPVAAFTLPL